MEVKGRYKDINDCIWKLNGSMVMDDDVFVFYDLKIKIILGTDMDGSLKFGETSNIGLLTKGARLIGGPSRCPTLCLFNFSNVISIIMFI